MNFREYINENKELDNKYQLTVNQIFEPSNVETMIKRAKEADDKILIKYLELIKNVDIKKGQTVRLTIEG